MTQRGRVTVLLLLALGLASFGPLRPERARAPAAAPQPVPVDPARTALVEAVAARLAEGGLMVPEEIERLAPALVDESRRAGLAPSLVLAVMEVESRFDPFAVSPMGAMGLMQVLPATGRALARQLGIEWRGARTLFDPVANLRIGVAYLAQMRQRFGHLATALAAYNVGPGAIGRRVQRGAPIPASYAERVLSAYAQTRLQPISSS
jgi:soluble lytic murein transglycosylase-like protein